MSYHKWDVDSSDDINSGVTGGLLRNKDKSFWVQGINLGAVLQESYVLPRPVFPGVEKGIGQLVQMSAVLIFTKH